ncbi:MAG: hypothetical protein HY721_25560 [Planctomycetes bacterium]|nr:hypothetical protein [Planctomycetota bacterium]
MIPSFRSDGNLPRGVHWSSWRELAARFGTTRHRRRLLSGLRKAIASLRHAACRVIYIDGSFVTAKPAPNDFDGCWSVFGVQPDKIDPVLLDFRNGRASQKAKYGGELFPAELPEGATGRRFLEFFQIDRRTGRPKGIVGLRLRSLPR